MIASEGASLTQSGSNQNKSLKQNIVVTRDYKMKKKKLFQLDIPCSTSTSTIGIQHLRDKWIDQRFLLGCEILDYAILILPWYRLIE